MILFLATALILLALLAVIPFWAGTGLNGVPFAMIGLLAAGVLFSAIFGRAPKD
ncbi:hypothetical protein [Pseudoroseomonas ludipueritiae]|uniref:Uncharacterized protein n=1 Tax=Pseudoroseomonas ludipueritiae TaxID=198093 RepID=A0ABR7R7S6_9PROT|nr:hypothetical protein [Pseudoroseomonas ludipueritiae]MBC9177788.1 hypothetical protein [Pseudoroseomonas ludipueritiae]MCG7360701.1 hypothetical protein [Roseomonas sp. ACRSG]